MPLTANSLKHKNILPLSVFLISVLSTIFFIVLFSSIRCEPDDMIIRLECSNNTLLQIFINHYNVGSFRPVFVLISFLTLGYTKIFVFYILLYLLFIFTIYKLLKEIFFVEKLSINQKALLIAFSNIAVMCVYFLTTEHIEIFGWISASIIHLVPIVFVFLSAWLIIKKQKTTDYIWLSICTFFVAGGAEHIAISTIMSVFVLAGLLFFVHRKNKKCYAEYKAQLMKAAFFFVLLSVCFAFFIYNPGTQIRYQQENNFVQSHASLYSTGIFSLLGKPHKITGFLFLFVFWMFFKNSFQIKTPKIKPSYFTIISIAIFIITSLISVFIFNTFSIGRIWFVFDISLFVLVNACIIKSIDLKTNIVVLYAGAGIFLIMLALFDIRHIPALLNFSSQHDKLIYSLQQKPAEETIVLQSFPNPDLTNQVELSADPNNDVNQLFCRFYNIKAKVSVKK